MPPIENPHKAHPGVAGQRPCWNMSYHAQPTVILACALIAGTLLYPASALPREIDAKHRSGHRPAKSLAAVKTYEKQIRMLQARVDALEAQLSTVMAALPTPVLAFKAGNMISVSGSAPSPTAASDQPSGAGGAVQNAEAGNTTTAPLAQTTPTAAAQSKRDPGKTSAKVAGAFDIDEDSAQRALERTLTQSGALLLEPGTVEVAPGFQYSRSEQSTALLISFAAPASGAPLTSITQNRTRRNEFNARADVRVGLPMNAQAEFTLPFTRVSATQQNSIETETSSSASGTGDVSFGIAKTLVREKGALPDLIGRLTYTVGASRKISGLQTGSGVNQLQAELVAVKRQDPLAFVGSIAYAKTFEKDGLKPGDGIILSLSSLLAASPATSLQLGFSQVVRAKQKVGGVTLDGSQQSYGVINLGASSVLSRDMTLVTQFGIGLGSDAPRYSVGLSLPILFR